MNVSDSHGNLVRQMCVTSLPSKPKKWAFSLLIVTEPETLAVEQAEKRVEVFCHCLLCFSAWG